MVGAPRLATVVSVTREDLERGLLIPPNVETYVVAFRTELEEDEETSVSSGSTGYPRSSISIYSKRSRSSLSSQSSDLSSLLRRKY